MKTFHVLSLLLATALAYPSGNIPSNNGYGDNDPGYTPGGSSNGGGKVCPRVLYSSARCCSTDVLGIAGLDCKPPSSATSVDDFKSSCSEEGMQASCCVILVAGQDVLCTVP